MKKLLILLIPFVFNCTFISPPFNQYEKPVLVARDYSLNEIKEYYPEYYKSLIKPINLYERFKKSVTDTLTGIDELFVDINSDDKEFLLYRIMNSKYAAIGLESIDIDSSFFDKTDTLKIKKPYFKIFKYPVPFLNYLVYDFQPIGPIEDYFIINCNLFVGIVSKHNAEGTEYRLKLYTKQMDGGLAISRMEISEFDNFNMTIPYMLRPLIWFKH